MYTHKKGKSDSTRPVSKHVPAWCKYKSEEVESLIVKLAKEGTPPSKIGVILRDQYGISLAKLVTDKKINAVLRKAELAPKIPEDLAALLKKATALRTHLEKHKADSSNIHSLELIESKIHRLSNYYRKKGLLPPDWKYEPAVAALA